MFRIISKLSILMLALLLVMALVFGCGGSGGKEPQPAGEEQGEPQQEPQETAFYEGETLEMLVPFGAGGGTDVFARFVAPYYNKHAAGQPAVQVVNVPGGGSVIGANEFVKLRKHDGFNALVTSASTHFPYLLGEKEVQYDLREMKPVLGLPTGGVVYVSPSTGITGPQDIGNAREKLVYAGISATGLDLVTLLSFEVLKMDVQAILGYEGRGPSRVAFEQGESNVDYQTSSAYLTNVVPLVGNGTAVPLFSFGQLDENGNIVRDPAFPEIPSIKEFYEEAYGEEPSGVAWDAFKGFANAAFTVQKIVWLHSDAPEEAVQALAEASEAAVADPDFTEKGVDVLGGYTPYIGKNVEAAVNNMLAVSEEVKDWLRNFLADEYGVTRLK